MVKNLYNLIVNDFSVINLKGRDFFIFFKNTIKDSEAFYFITVKNKKQNLETKVIKVRGYKKIDLSVLGLKKEIRKIDCFYEKEIKNEKKQAFCSSISLNNEIYDLRFILSLKKDKIILDQSKLFFPVLNSELLSTKRAKDSFIIEYRDFETLDKIIGFYKTVSGENNNYPSKILNVEENIQNEKNKGFFNINEKKYFVYFEKYGKKMFEKFLEIGNLGIEVVSDQKFLLNDISFINNSDEDLNNTNLLDFSKYFSFESDQVIDDGSNERANPEDSQLSNSSLIWSVILLFGFLIILGLIIYLLVRREGIKDNIKEEKLVLEESEDEKVENELIDYSEKEV